MKRSLRFLKSSILGLMLTVSLPGHAAEVPSSDFLTSVVLLRPGVLDLGSMSVERYVETLTDITLTDGSKPKVEGWEKEGNRHTLKLRLLDHRVTLTFVHDLRPQSDGRYSLLLPVYIGQEPISALQFTLLSFGQQ